MIPVPLPTPPGCYDWADYAWLILGRDYVQEERCLFPADVRFGIYALCGAHATDAERLARLAERERG